MSITYFWLIAFIVLIVIEMITMGLTTVWFAAGALLAAIASAMGVPLWVQILLFVAASIIMLIFTRPVALKYFNKGRIKTNTDSLVGKQAIVLEEINNLKGTGQVAVNGQQWTARAAQEDCVIENGAVAVIRSIQGVKLMVEPVAIKREIPEEEK